MFFFLLDYNPQIKPLNINIQYTKNFYAATMITKNLQNVFGSSIVFTDQIEDADLIISDHYEHDESLNGQFFLFRNNFEPDDWSLLLKNALAYIHTNSFHKRLN